MGWLLLRNGFIIIYAINISVYAQCGVVYFLIFDRLNRVTGSMGILLDCMEWMIVNFEENLNFTGMNLNCGLN